MKKILPIVAALALLAIIAFAFYNYAGSKTDTVKPTTESGRTASLMAKFVDRALDEETGTYDLFFHCSQEQQACAPQHDPTKPPHMGYSIMSLALTGKIEKDQRLIDKADLLLDEAIEKCQTVDPRYCEWNFFPLHLYYQDTGNEKYLNAMLHVEDSVMSDRSVRELLSYNLPVKWWRFYDATGDEKYRDQLTKLADAQLESYPNDRQNDDLIYTNGNTDIRKFDLPIIWALYAPAYEVSGDMKYLQPAMDFFRSADLSEHTNEFFDVTTTGDLAKGTEALLTLAKADPDNREFYLNETKKILETVLTERWDTPEKKLINGDYGVLVSPTEKATNIQGWMIYVISKLENDFGVTVAGK